MHDLVEETCVTEHVAQLVVTGKDVSTTLDLYEGQSALVGQAAGCQLRLEADDVAPHQCMLELQDGILMLDNWSEDGSTKVNDKVVTDQVTLNSGDTISFSGYRIQFRFDGDQDTLDGADSSLHGPSQGMSPAKKMDSVESSTIEVLYSEIDFLQRELEQRDAALAEAGSAAVNDSAARSSKKDSSKRLNELVAELQTADERLLCLTDELHHLEDLHAAEHEEQRQLTTWVNEVEGLIAKREAEQLAQLELLRAQLDQANEDCRFQQQRADALAANNGRNDIQVALTELRAEYESLREKHKDALNRTEDLEQECETFRAANVDAAVEKRIQDAVRLEQLELAQERAKISRREHELAEKVRQMDSQLEAPKTPGEADAKIDAFREQLKEFQRDRADLAPATAKQRLVNLWQTLDGRSHE